MRELFLVLLLAAPALQAQDAAFKWISARTGTEVPFDSVVAAASRVQVVFFGESHDNPVAHFHQLRLLKSLAPAAGSQWALGMEMFETDRQVVIDEYLAGIVNRTTFESDARAWPNHKTDYRPLVEYAKSVGMRVVGTNVPRRYASLVYQKGFDALEALPAEAKAWLPPLPIAYDPELPGYKGILEAAGGHGGANLPMSQALKDATMGWSIGRMLRNGLRVLHVNGSYHSDGYEGIVWYLKREVPGTRMVTITAQYGGEPDLSKADFILWTHPDMTRTH